MNPIMSSTKVMQNFTICIARPIRERMQIKKGDRLILSMDENGEVKVTKAIGSFKELKGAGKEAFKALGGGEQFLKKERDLWAK